MTEPKSWGPQELTSAVKKAAKGMAGLVLAAAALPILAAGLPPQYAGSPTAKDYPHADVLVLSESRDFTFLPDGRQVEKVRRVEKILTYQGMDETGDPKVSFNKREQELSIGRCRTYTADGQTVDAKANSFNEMTPFELERAPAYTDWRQMVITKVGLDINCVVELEYTLTDKRPWRRYLEGVERFEDQDPALERSVSVTVPEGTALRYRLFNAQAEPVVTRTGGAVTTTWTLRRVPLAPPDEMGSQESDFLPTLVFTTCPGWGQESSAIGGLVAKAEAATSPQLTKKEESLLTGVRTPFEKIVALSAYVADDINTVRWPLRDFDFAPRGAAEVYDSGYGNALDKAVLLCAMLKGAGIGAAIWAGRRSVPGGLDPEPVPCMAQMNAVLVRVEGAGGPLWLDPTASLSQRSQRDFAGFKGLLLGGGSDDLQPLPPVGGTDRLEADLEATAAADLSLEGKGLITLLGRYSPFYAVQGDEKAQRSYLAAFVEGLLPGSELTDCAVVRLEPQQGVFRVLFKTPAPKAEAGIRALSTGLPGESLLARYPSSYLGERTIPLVLRGSGKEHFVLRITLPEGAGPLYLPNHVQVSSTAGNFTQSWGADGRILTMDAAAEIPGRIIQPKDYEAWRDLFGIANAQAERWVLFGSEEVRK
ncbi:MAG: DUF3857 domain-containing transglutaminase family protein [Acidobacteriota bacterium]